MGEAREMLDELEGGAEKISSVVRDLQTLARRGRGGKRKPIDVSVELETALRLGTLKLRGKASIVANISRLPKVYMEEGALIHVFNNLLSNAVQAIAAKGPGAHHISVDTALEGDYVVIEIRDSGIGMSETMCRRAFQPFVSTKNPGAGTGVGLTVARQVIEHAGGTIKLESVENEGTTVTLEIPVYEPA